MPGRAARPGDGPVTPVRLQQKFPKERSMRRIVIMSILALALAWIPAGAQTAPCPCPPTAPPPPPPWTGAVSFGLAITSGNSDSSNINLAADLKRATASSPWVFKAGALYLRGDQHDELTVDKTTFTGRVEYKFSPAVFAFGQYQYLRDQFQNIDYLMAPSGGLGYNLIDNPTTLLTADAGVGVVWEKNPGEDVRTSGAVTAGEQFRQKLSPGAAFSQKFAALWKTADFGDALYAFSLGIVADITPRTALKAEFLDTYKTQPVGIGTVKNDVALLTSLVFKVQ
jgi:putative salt-induced outer membrane protein